VCGYLSGRDNSIVYDYDIASTRYGHGPPEVGFKGNRNM